MHELLGLRILGHHYFLEGKRKSLDGVGLESQIDKSRKAK